MEFLTEEGQKEAARVLREHDIQGVVVIGGDGSFRGARDLAQNCGVPVIGVPGTIDNDLNYTDYTIGFDTAVNTVLSAINNLRDTMTSHDRVSIIEVMGRNCGDIAMYAGLAGGCEYMLVPEVEPDYQALAHKLNQSNRKGKTSDIILVAEGVGTADMVKEKLEGLTDVSFRTTVLGHIQRGGMPTMQDRVLASRLGVKAVDLLKKGIVNRAVGIRQNEVIDVDLTDALTAEKNFDYSLYNVANVLSL